MIKCSEAVISSRLCHTGEEIYVTNSDLHRYGQMQTAFAFLMIYTALMCSWRSKEEHYIRTKQSLANDKPWLLKSQSCISLFTEYSWSDSTMALSLSTVQVHNGLSHQTTHSCCLFCAGISTTLAVEIKLFSFFSGINVMQHK